MKRAGKRGLRKVLGVISAGSIGRRYARNDEIGTPFCITIDEDSLKFDSVTIRFRDNKQQKRVKISKLKETLRQLVNQEIEFKELN